MTFPAIALAIGFVVGQRIGELWISHRNTKLLLQRGGREVGAGHYPLFLLLHLSWLVAMALFISLDRQPNMALIGLYLLLQVGRIWVMATLGPYWTTRIITLDGAPLIRSGPFRFMRHPNYWIVIAEIAVLPLAFGAWQIALIWSALNLTLLRHRIAVEERALAGRPEQRD